MNGDNYSSRDGGRHGPSRDYPPPRRDRGDRTDRDERRDRGGDRGGGRRRSRSPDYRGGRSRRDDIEPDPYTSSRRHQEREREDRYTTGRDRRPDREWDRDRGSRRDARREDDDRYDRMDRRGGRDGGREGGREGGRDLFEDRRGGGGGRRERDLFERERRRSATPPPKKREPTPDLTGVIPIVERKRRLTQWDIKPPGYENVPAEQAKLSGMFPLPGAPRQQAMDPTKLQPMVSQPSGGGGGGGRGGGGDGGGGGGGGRGDGGNGGNSAGPPVGSANSTILKPTNSRQSKRLVAWNIPKTASEDDILSFFNLQLNGLNVIESTDPCIMCQVSPDHRFAMLEFKTAADTTVAFALDGITMEASSSDTQANGAPGAGGPAGLEIKRPKDYIVPAIADEAPYEPGVISSVVTDTPNKISIANIPPYLTDEQVTELLVSFGELKAFVLVKDSGTDESRGIAFCEYTDSTATDVAIQGLHGMELGDKRLKVQKASVGITQVSGEMGVNAMSMLAGTISIDPDVSRVLQLLNMVTPDELIDNDDYEEIREDVLDECSKFGTVLELKIPRPAGGSRQSNGVGKIYIKYDTPESAKRALQALAGRKFADRTVVTTYFPEENFDVGAW